MILKLLALGAELSPGIKESEAAVEGAFKRSLDEEHFFTNYYNEKDFIKGATQAVSEDVVIVMAAEPGIYNSFKNFIAKLFNFKMKTSKTVLKRIQEKHPELSEEAAAPHALLPAVAQPLLSRDGVYSGFAVKTRKQLLIVLPLDDNRIDNIINRSLQPFIRANLSLIMPELGGEGQLGELEEAGVSEILKSSEFYNAELIKDTLTKLSKNGLTVALANTQTVDFVNNISTTAIDLSETVFISRYVNQKGERSGREYAVDLAKGALLNSDNSVGASITKVFSAKDESGKTEMFMYVCIADTLNANVAKLSAEEGETAPELIYKAVEELFRMLGQWADTGYAKPQFGDEKLVNEQKAAKDADRRNMKISAAASFFLIASFAASIAVSLLCENFY